MNCNLRTLVATVQDIHNLVKTVCICRLDYQPLFHEMSLHSSPEKMSPPREAGGPKRDPRIRILNYFIEA